MLKINDKCMFLIVSPKISDQKDAKIIFLLVKYVLDTYRLLFGGP